jgi:DNA-binding transcriptional ArsR family regulator
MVECPLNLDFIFSSLADPTRRDIFQRVAKQTLSVSEIAKPYKLTFAAVSKHLKVLENAKLVTKHRRGKQQYVQLAPEALRQAKKYLKHCQTIWESRLDSLGKYSENFKSSHINHPHKTLKKV